MNLRLQNSLLILIFLISLPAHSLEQSDKDKLKNLGYSWSSFYKDNYRGKKTKWISLDEHLKLKPKFLALVEQDLKVNNKKENYKYVYNSKHNFFKMEIIGEKKRITPILVNPLSKKYLGPTIIEDENINLSQFIEKVLDHCKFSKGVSVTTEEGKKLNFRNEEECKIKYVNFDEFEKLTYENFEKDNNLSLYNPSVKQSKQKKIVKKIDKETDQNKLNIKTESIKTKKIKSFNSSIAINWLRNGDLLVGDLNYDDKKNSGVIEFNSSKNGKCMGTFNFIEKKGTWSFSCNKNNTTAFGEIYINDNIVEGNGFDKKKNKIKFVSKKINE
ncbi:hypothetical protein OAY20_05395 [Candidatus Pelagibacter bacterium]|nr:hypothetical protein [Candidatus Pelagibacter bacterium]MEC7143336.1 hypothetical protein [Pseudomonadota bacterium]